MQLCKFFKVMSIVIVLALTYIHMQMQIVDLAYRGNKKEQQIKRLVEENGNMTYKILILKSANHLGVAMLEENPDMQFADAHDVVQIAAPKELLMEDQLNEQSKLAKRTNPLLSLLSFGIEAEAKTAE
ncbi:MAG: hypothetical protein KAS66_01075 [Candidatus Omnitrophica bacterium]|nr:hypothetical protein [Candidatus Omnitrophota bacterium]